MLADAGADVYCKHKVTKSNALHVAIANKHYSVAMQLVKSKFPPNELNFEEATPLLMIVDDISENGIKLAKELLKHNCD